MIQGIGNGAMMPQTMQASKGNGGPFAKVAAQFTNEAGQSLGDIRNELRDTVQATLQDGGGKEAVQSAVRDVLEANGFDADGVMSAIDAMRPRRGPPGLGASGGRLNLPAGSILSTRA